MNIKIVVIVYSLYCIHYSIKIKYIHIAICIPILMLILIRTLFDENIS